MVDYSIFYKRELPTTGDWPADVEWDTFISAFTSAERVQSVFNKAKAGYKQWLVFPEYGYAHEELPAGNRFVNESRDEAEYIKTFWQDLPANAETGRIAVDTTGFIRPYLLFLVRWLAEKGVRRFDALYTEPIIYKKRELTKFSDEAVVEVRQVSGFEGNHIPDVSNDCLIIGAGYDHSLISHVAENKEFTRKIQIFGLPSLRADMYQENVLRAHEAEEAVGRNGSDELSTFFAPANDPFVTASVLHEIVARTNARRKITNLYMTPLATKPQVVAFALFHLTECRGQAVSMIFPFCRSYAQETSTGVSRIWSYTVELPQLS